LGLVLVNLDLRFGPELASAQTQSKLLSIKPTGKC
jgi:hypothetical protein